MTEQLATANLGRFTDCADYWLLTTVFGGMMNKLWTAVLCLTLTGFATAQTAGSATSKHAATTTAQPTAVIETTRATFIALFFPNRRRLASRTSSAWRPAPRTGAIPGRAR